MILPPQSSQYLQWPTVSHCSCKLALGWLLTLLHHGTLQDLRPLMALIHRRCRDSKAVVRKSALQLLEAAVVMRATWQGHPRELPRECDLDALEAATRDPLVRQGPR